MRRSISASIGLVSAMAGALLFVAASHAQVNGPPASVTSPGFGGNPVNGARPSVTSLGPQGYPSGPGFVGPNGAHHGKGDHAKGKDGDHRKDNSGYTGPLYYALPVPYPADDNGVAEDNADADANDPNDQGGPTVFDHHGPPPRPLDPSERDAHPAHAKPADRAAEDEPPAEPEPAPEPTLLVFKDGRSLEVGNYAIQGATLFDLTPGHKRKIALMDLDLEATRRQNDERGVTFQLPSSYKAN